MNCAAVMSISNDEHSPNSVLLLNIISMLDEISRKS